MPHTNVETRYQLPSKVAVIDSLLRRGVFTVKLFSMRACAEYAATVNLYCKAHYYCYNKHDCSSCFYHSRRNGPSCIHCYSGALGWK